MTLVQQRGLGSRIRSYLGGQAKAAATLAIPAPRQAPVRGAATADVAAMLELCTSKEQLRGIPVSDRKITRFLHDAIRSTEHCCLVSPSSESGLEGFLVGHVADHPFTDERCARDVAVFIRPQPLGSTVPYRLWEVFEHWARGMGATALYCGAAAGIVPERSRRFHADLGMTEVGSLYRLDLKLTPL